MKTKIAMLMMVVCLVVAMLAIGCAEVQYGGAKMFRLGDSNTEDLYAEHCSGPMRITVDANTGLLNYYLTDTNSTFTQFSFGSSVSEGRFPALTDLVPVIVEALIQAGLAPASPIPE